MKKKIEFFYTDNILNTAKNSRGLFNMSDKYWICIVVLTNQNLFKFTDPIVHEIRSFFKIQWKLQICTMNILLQYEYEYDMYIWRGYKRVI